MSKRCFIMAGGTGGHVFPGLAVAHALQAKGWQVEWLGTAERMEAQVVPQHGFKIHFVSVKGMRGKGAMTKIGGTLALMRGMVAARKIIQRHKPDLVIGFGGYASGPGGFAAWSLGIPVVIHEQNAAAGLTNRLLGRIAQLVLLGFDKARESFRIEAARCITVGNPVRSEFLSIPAKEQSDQPLRMLVVGGSLGSAPLNSIVPKVCKKLAGLSVWHQCGKGHRDAVSTAYDDAVCELKIEEFIDDMAAAYAWADFIVCRAGALTVAEVSVAGKAAIFVPLPHAVDDHQTLNALSLVDKHAALMIPQALLEDNLGAAIRQWIKHPEACVVMGKQAKALSTADATENVVNRCLELVGEDV